MENNEISIIPLRDCVLCEIINLGEAKSKSGLFLTSPILTRACKLGRVIKIGDGEVFMGKKNMINIKLKEGNIVIINEHAGQSINVKGKEYIIVTYNEIFGKWENMDEDLGYK